MGPVNDDIEAGSGGVTRAGRAAQTRRRMTSAAYGLFVERGYPGTTMTAIAEEAGVAVQTLYFTFGTKAQLLQHAYEFAVIGDHPAPPQLQPWYSSMRSAEDLPEALDILVENVAAVFARTAPLDEFVRAGSSDPEAARVRAYNEKLRRDSWADMIDQLTTHFPLRSDLDHRHATDILLVLMSPTTYQALVANYGWRPTEWRAWCANAIRHQLFAPARPPDSEPR
jgi:AcrR family transcriptional regulator